MREHPGPGGEGDCVGATSSPDLCERRGADRGGTIGFTVSSNQQNEDNLLRHDTSHALRNLPQRGTTGMTTGRFQNNLRRTGRRGGNGQGFTLMEILVVLVLLLIGIMAILRLFPGGFLVIRRTGELTMAQALANQQAEALKNLASVPQSISSAVIDVNNNVIPINDIEPTNLTDCTQAELTGYGVTLPDNYDLYYLSNINRIRYIKGESVRVPVPNANAAQGYGSVYMLQVGPVFNRFTTDSTGNPKDSVSVHGAPMERVELPLTSGSGIGNSQDYSPSLSGPSQYAIDYVGGKNGPLIAFDPSLIGKKVLIDFAYYAAPNANTLPTVKELIYTITVQPNPDGNNPNGIQAFAQPIFDNTDARPQPADYVALKPESEIVSRKFTLMSQTAGTPVTWDPGDPYQYAWYSPQEANGFSNPGVLVFNPLGRAYVERTSTGTRPLSVFVDYAVFDNHVLREDRTLAPIAPYSVRLSVPFILTNGDILPDQTTYTGIFRLPNDSASPDVLIYNVNTGEEVARYVSGAASPNDSAGNPAFSLNVKTGTITFTSQFVQDKRLQNATLRLFYRAQNEWGMQVQKAESRYNQSAAITGMLNNNYYLNAGSGFGTLNRIYFRISEAGKTIVLGQYYVQPATGPALSFSNEIYHINDNSANYESGPDGTKYTWIDLSDQHPESKTNNWHFTDAPTGQAISGIYGASVKSRVVWRSADNWRKVETDTFLVPAPTR